MLLEISFQLMNWIMLFKQSMKITVYIPRQIRTKWLYTCDTKTTLASLQFESLFYAILKIELFGNKW